jgi:anhydro-N-acetylmuramic acid kinase
MEKILKPVRIVGLMSGTSLDGLDVALCEFSMSKEQLEYHIIKAETLDYPREIKDRLSCCGNFGLTAFLDFHRKYGYWLGNTVRDFLDRHQLKADYIGSHGHTVFHEPQVGRNFQLGEASAIAAAAGMPVVSDFRSLDVCLGGQGAPLVPIGDELLFSAYGYRINLGGFCNVSLKRGDHLLAWDIGPFNLAMNYLAAQMGLEYDEDGRIASTGKVDKALVAELNGLPYYQLDPPKSLGREWFEREFIPRMEKYTLSTADKLASFSEHIAYQITMQCKGAEKDNLLITGGGAYNLDFLSRLRRMIHLEVIVPDANLVNYKEALIFALLAYLRIHEQVNTYRSVSGAKQNSCGGSIVWNRLMA